jgi:predicted DNA-binding antitoxin AbrB/MazE fold protein
MVRIAEAIFADGKLTPTGPLNLEEHQRVRITVAELTPS